MKILQISPDLPGKNKSGGAEKLFLDLADGLGSKGYEVKLLASPELLRVRAKIPRKLFFDYYNPYNLLILNGVINKFHADLIHFHNVYGIGSHLVEFASKRRPTVVTVHDYWPFCYFSTMTKNGSECGACTGKNTLSLGDNLLHDLHKKVNYHHYNKSALVAPSRYMAEQLEQAGNFNVKRIIPNGVSIPDETTQYQKLIIWVGRINREKGLATVAPFLDTLAAKGGWRVQVLGTGDQKEELEKRFHHLNFAGHQNPEDYYKKASLLVMSSLWPENMPYTALEAMSYGIPVIAPNCGGLPEIIDQNKNGFLFNDIGDFQQLLKELTDNEHLIRKSGKLAREKIKNCYGIQTSIDRYATLYNQLIV